MIEETIEKRVIQKCNQCEGFSHKWFEVYFSDRTTLKKADKTYITWCEKTGKYVLTSKK